MIIGVIIICSTLICFVFVNKNKYNVNKPPFMYLSNNIRSHTKYTNFIKKYIVPEKLANFLNVVNIRFSEIEKCDTGTQALEWFRYEAYKELFYQMFDKKRKGYEDCPVTENFKNKFGNNLFEYFKFNNVEDSDIGCILSDEEKALEITEAGDFNVGEPGYIYYHHFHYVLDDDGNVDDVIFDYTE